VVPASSSSTLTRYDMACWALQVAEPPELAATEWCALHKAVEGTS
jgi:hypothetical protein